MNNESHRCIFAKFSIFALAFLAVLIFGIPLAQAETSQQEEVAALKAQVQQLLKRIEALEQAQSKVKEAPQEIPSVIDQAPQSGVYSNKKLCDRLPEYLKETPSVQNQSAQVSLYGEKRLFDQLPDYLTRGFEFGGYFRSGFGINSKGGKMEAFQAPDTLAKYRLGNEQDTYLETAFTEKNWNPDPNGIKILTQVRISYGTQQNQTSDDTNKVNLREVYAEMGNFVATDPNVKVWAGQRFYRLPQLEIDDFWWYDMSGYGGGIQDINFFNLGNLDIAYIGFADTDINLSTNHGRIAKNNLNFMLKDVAVPGGKGTFWVNGSYVRQGTFEGVSYPDAPGVDVGFMHQSKIKDANNQLGLQYGYGSGTSLSAGAINVPLIGSDKDSWRFRLTDMYNKKFNDKLSLQAIAVYQYTDDGKTTNFRENWVSFGFRPVYGLSKYLALEIEPGVDYVDNQQDNFSSFLFKFTTALRIAPSAAFDSVPRFRVYATYAHWGDSFKGHAGGGEAFSGNNDGLNFGVQCEHWW